MGKRASPCIIPSEKAANRKNNYHSMNWKEISRTPFHAFEDIEEGFMEWITGSLKNFVNNSCSRCCAASRQWIKNFARHLNVRHEVLYQPPPNAGSLVFYRGRFIHNFRGFNWRGLADFNWQRSFWWIINSFDAIIGLFLPELISIGQR